MQSFKQYCYMLGKSAAWSFNSKGCVGKIKQAAQLYRGLKTDYVEPNIDNKRYNELITSALDGGLSRKAQHELQMLGRRREQFYTDQENEARQYAGPGGTLVKLNLPDAGLSEFRWTYNNLGRPNQFLTGAIDSARLQRLLQRRRWLQSIEKIIIQHNEKQAAKGIPDRKDYGDLSNINIGQLVDWIVQKHDAERAGTHYDVRFGTPESGLYSWAARKGLPKPGEKNLAVQQPLHSYDYKDFEGRIEEGYGKGNVKKQDSGEILLTDVSPNKINFTTGSKRFPERFSLVRTGKGKNWLLLNTTPTKSVGVDKVHYKVVDADKVQPLIDDLSKGSSVQAKIDGASSLINLVKDKVELLSYRQNKATGYPIFHTERAFGGIPKGVPKDLNDTTLRGELYGLKNNKVIPPSELGGLLNSGVAKSLKDQKDRGIQLRNMVYDIAKYKGKEIDVNKIPYEQRMKYIKEILDKIPHGDRFEVAQEAKTPDEARSLLDSIRSGQHPQTSEGIVIHPPTGNPIKSKLLEEQDVHIREFFPGKGRLLDKGVGGFKYSLTPTGPILGEVGTGLTDDMRSQMHQDQGSFIGRRARVRSQGALPSGALRAPALISLHEDYPLMQGQ